MAISWLGPTAKPNARSAAWPMRSRHTPLHTTWLWRELTRVAVAIAQAGGYQAKADQLRMTLIGAPVDHDDNTTGLAVAKRVFLDAAPLFRANRQTDSKDTLWPEFWGGRPVSLIMGRSRSARRCKMEQGRACVIT